MSYRLHYSPDSANIIIHMILEEIGVDYELVLVDRSIIAHKSDEFLQLNPQGLIPVLEDNGQAIFETAAIALHLADKHCVLAPQKNQIASRALLYQWLFYLSNTLHSDIRIFFYSHRYVSDPAAKPALIIAIKGRIIEHLDLIEQQLCCHSEGVWFMGELLSVLDFYLAALCRWICIYPVGDCFNHSIWDNKPQIKKLLENLQLRHSVISACQQELISAPYFTNGVIPDLPAEQVTG